MINNERIDIKNGDVFDIVGAKWIGKSGVSGSENAPAPLIRKVAELKAKVLKATL